MSNTLKKQEQKRILCNKYRIKELIWEWVGEQVKKFKLELPFLIADLNFQETNTLI